MTALRRRSFVAAAVVAMLFGSVRAGADGNDMDPLLEATLQLKVQSYDHKIANRLAKGFVVCIIYRAGSSPSESAAQEMREAFARAAERYKIKGVTVAVDVVGVDPARPGEALRGHNASMIYVVPGLDGAIPEIAAAANRLKVPTSTHVRDYISAGLGIAVTVDRHKPKIVVNLKAVTAAGMELDADMLGLAEVVR